MTETILYQNRSRSVILLDIPRSIEQGQAALTCLLSSRAPEAPYPSTEPKGEKRTKLLNEVPLAEQAYHDGIYHLILEALQEVRLNMKDGDWCYPRKEFSKSDPDMPPILADNNNNDDAGRQVLEGIPVFLSALDNRLAHLSDIRASIFINSLRSATTLTADAHLFHIPPQSVFLCSKISDGLPLIGQVLTSNVFFTGAEHSPACFDLVLLDPPWTNRSVRHAKTYRTAETQDDPFHEILPFIRSHVKPDGIVAIWITNSPSLRRRVVNTMTALGYAVGEEWIWLKITRKGEPVTEVDGLWRKPYEVLLLFTKSAQVASDVRRRVVIAVPDFHSRKPCLKTLFETILPQPYRALEIFARSLVSGWWSWGDECLKFQHSSQWWPS